MSSCLACRFCQSAKHTCLNGVGPIPCDVMVVGQAPGAEEDERGEVFVGSAWRILQRLLASIGLSRRTVRLTNAVRCFPGGGPGGDVKPGVSEIYACRHYLVKEIARARPKVILALGEVARTALLGRGAVESSRGRVFNLPALRLGPDPASSPVLTHKAAVVVSYHPAYYLRSWAPYRRGELDFALVGRMLQGNEAFVSPPKPVVLGGKYVDLSFDDWVAYDLETTGFRHRYDKILTIALCGREGQPYVLDLRGRNDVDLAFIWSWLDRLLCRLPRVAHHHKFDDRFLLQQGLTLSGPVHDTMCMHQVLDDNSPHNLGDVALEYLKVQDYGFAFRAGLADKDDYGSGPPQALYDYTATDVWCVAKLFGTLSEQLHYEGLWRIYERSQLSMSKLLLGLEMKGLLIDRDSVEMQHRDALQLELQIYQRLRLLSADKLFNPQSPRQVAKLLFGRLGVPRPGVKTKTGQDCVAAPVLEKLKAAAGLSQNATEALDLLLQLSGLPDTRQTGVKKLITTYLKGRDGLGGILPHIQDDGRVRASFRQDVVTGRTSASDPPVHNLPRTSRAYVIAAPGCDLVHADYQQLEIRILAHLAGDKALLKALRRGDDIHKFVAGQVFDVAEAEVTPQQRGSAKAVVFGMIYGQMPKGLAERLGCSEEAAAAIQAKFFERFPAILHYMTACHQEARRQACIESPFGRRRRLLGYTLYRETENLTPWRQGELDRQAGNFPIQSTGADVLSFAARRIHDRLATLGLDAGFTLFHHDALLLEVAKEDSRQVVAVVKKEMERPIKELDGAVFPVEIKILERWE